LPPIQLRLPLRAKRNRERLLSEAGVGKRETRDPRAVSEWGRRSATGALSSKKTSGRWTKNPNALTRMGKACGWKTKRMKALTRRRLMPCERRRTAKQWATRRRGRRGSYEERRRKERRSRGRCVGRGSSVGEETEGGRVDQEGNDVRELEDEGKDGDEEGNGMGVPM
jgi:hypothetical protein